MVGGDPDARGRPAPAWAAGTIASMKRYIRIILLTLVAFVVITVARIALQSPEDVDRQVIADCWTESRADSTAPEKRPITVGACEALEKVFQMNYGIKLNPGAKDV